VTTLRTRFPSAYESVAKARRAVGTFAHDCGFSAPEVSDIVLAVGEACSNAVEHGHTPGGFLTISCSFEAGVLSIEIADGGAGFDERAAIDTGDWVGRGRGIRIMRALMDAISHRSTPSGTTVVMEKRLLTGRGAEARSESVGCDPGGAR